MSIVRLSCLILVFLSPVQLYAAPMGTSSKPKPPSFQLSMLNQVCLVIHLIFL